MSRSFPLSIFAIVFAGVYIYSFATGWTMFRYYPLIGEITTLDLPVTEGPAMGWYSWIAQGFVAGSIVALLALAVPRSLAERVWSGIAWAGIVLIIVYTFHYEWHWFQGR